MSPFPAEPAGSGLGGYRLALQCNGTDLPPLDCQDLRTLLLYNAESWRERGVATSQGEPSPPPGGAFPWPPANSCLKVKLSTSRFFRKKLVASCSNELAASTSQESSRAPWRRPAHLSMALYKCSLIDGLWRWGCDNPRQSPQKLGNPVLGLGERTSGLKWWVDTTAHLKMTLFLSVPKGTLQSLHVNPHPSINRSANQVSDQFSSSFLHQST